MLILCLLAIFVLNNIMLVSIETKMYDIAILRILGLNNRGVLYLIILQSIIFTLPAFLGGFILSIIGL